MLKDRKGNEILNGSIGIDVEYGARYRVEEQAEQILLLPLKYEGRDNIQRVMAPVYPKSDNVEILDFFEIIENF